MSDQVSATLGQLVDVLRAAGVSTDIRGPEDVSVSGMSSDSREVRPGDVFLAWKGTRLDGHGFVEDARDRGARAAVVERYLDVDISQIRVPNGRRAAALIAHVLAGEPSRFLQVTAVTGTNGKTTTSLLIRHILSLHGPSAALGTLGLTGPDGRVRAGSEGLTTPGPVELARLLASLVAEGVTSVSLEASSHALDQRRLDGIRVDACVFTNLTRDHLDYHQTLASYREAKSRLLLLLRDDGGAVVNGADPAWAELPAIPGRLIVTRIQGEPVPGRPSSTGEALPDLVAEDLKATGEGTRFVLRWGGKKAEVALPLLGRFNVENALAAIGATLLLGLDLDECAGALSDVPSPSGRMEVTVRAPVPVVLDYAHTPHALARLLETVRPLYEGRIILVFGAGGDRDREKRAEMGAVAARGADLPIVTSDNPRTEDPDAIIDDILSGMQGGAYERVTDRREAIERALHLARPGDVVLLAGKGHESYQIVGDERRPFDERKVIREILASERLA